MTSTEQSRPTTTRFYENSDGPGWIPSEEWRNRSRYLSAMRKWEFDDINSLHAAAVENPEWFWSAAAEDLGLGIASDVVIDETAGKEFPRWFTDASVNAAELCVLRHARGPAADRTAVVYEGDSGQTRSLTFAELAVEVRRFAAHLTSIGVTKGDRILLFLPVIPEAVAAYMGAAMIGAITVPTFSGSSVDSLATRLQQSEAKVVVTVDATTRRGRPIGMKQIADDAIAAADSSAHTVVVDHLGGGSELIHGDEVLWHGMTEPETAVDAEDTGFNDPVAIIYTSGTTGTPKGIVHSHGGYSLKAAIDFAYGFDIDDSDTVGWIADMGWMLGPLLVMGPLQLGATIVLMEGVPNYPGPQRIWESINRHGITMQGFAPTAVRGLIAQGAVPDEELPTLRSFASTGEAWDEPSWSWLFDTVGGRTRPIINYTGGTETGGGLLVSYPFLPSRPKAFNGPLPGQNIDVVASDGRSVVSQVGELAVKNTWPGMTHSFWNDDERYRKTYWSTHSGIWIQGDLASVDTDGEWLLHGRSDDTLKIAGRRVGPSEIETTLITDRRITEAAVIGAPDPYKGERAVAFVVVNSNMEVDAEDLRAVALANVGKAFAPELIIVKDVPKTKNGKIMRRAIRAQHLGSELGDMSMLDPNTPLELIPRMIDERQKDDHSN